MKCVKDRKGKVTRVNNDVAYELVAAGKHAYCGKHEWKEQVRKD